MVVTAADLIGLSRPGVTVTGVLPDERWAGRWDRIVVPAAVKNRLLGYGLFCLTARSDLSMVGLPVHGVTLLSGPPGTGKTTLAQGLGHRLAVTLAERGLADEVLFAVVDPHQFPSDLLGRSQRAVSTLFAETLPELAGFDRPLVVLLDEVEALAVSRSRASFDTNPVDVHRATDAVLVGLDQLAGKGNIMLIATTNTLDAVDEAFLSRVDLHETFSPPGLDAVCEILVDTLAQIGVGVESDDPALLGLAELAVARGLDARRVRKAVLGAVISGGPELALHPRSLTLSDLTRYVHTQTSEQEQNQ